VLTWPATTAQNYPVQLKKNLNDPVWQSVNGSVNIVSNTASLMDYAPAPEQRFYRILAY